MSKARKINKVEVDIFEETIWIHVSWEGKPRVFFNGDEVRNRHYVAFAFAPKKRARLLKRGRQMQDILIAKWDGPK